MSIESTQFGGTQRLLAEVIVDAHINPNAAIQRVKLQQDDLKPYPIVHTEWRVWDNLAALLPATSASDDLGLYPGTWGTTPQLIRSADVKTTTVTLRAVCEVKVPAEYVAGETLVLRARAGMITTVCDGTGTIDFEVYRKTGDGAALSADLCATAAASIKSLTFADKDFTITPTDVVAGDVLQVRMTMAIVDTATGTAVIGAVESIKLLCDVKG
jgi:hypothetical protein